jgi:Alpha/beta hydrolase domain
VESEVNRGQASSLKHQPEERTSDGLAKELASSTISRRGALKLLGGASLGLLALPVFTSHASAAGKLQLAKTDPTLLGTFGGVKYVQYEGLFVGKSSTGRYSVPFRISAPANPRSGRRSTVLVEPPHFSQGTFLRESYLGRPFLFDRGFVHASVGYSTFANRILDPTAGGVFIRGGVFDGNGQTDDEIIVDFARALRSDPAVALIGPAARRYLAGFSDSSDPVKRIVASGLAEDVFDLVVPITTFNMVNPQDNPEEVIRAKKYSGKVISVNSELEWHVGRALEDRGTSPDHYRYFIVPGTPHIPDPLCDGTLGNTTTPAGWQPALRAHFLQGHDWVTKGVAPPASTRLATTGGVIARDTKRNALLVDITGASAPRLPFVEIGEATFIVPRALTGLDRLLGTYAPQPPPNIQDLGLSVEDYLAAFGKALNAQKNAGYILNEDAEVLLKRANLSPPATPPATFTLNYHDRYKEFRSCM